MIFDSSHMTNRSIHGNPVLPIIMRNVPKRSGRTALWKDIIESGVKVNPRSLNNDAGVKMPLNASQCEAVEAE